MIKKKNTNTGEEEKDTIVGQITKTDFALQEAMEEAGMEAKTYGIWGVLWKAMNRFGGREKQPVQKKKYIWLVILTGWFGGHRFYAKRYYLGAIYLVLFWSMIPVMMSMLDLLEVIPIKADENGYVMM